MCYLQHWMTSPLHQCFVVTKQGTNCVLMSDYFTVALPLQIIGDLRNSILPQAVVLGVKFCYENLFSSHTGSII